MRCFFSVFVVFFLLGCVGQSGGDSFELSVVDDGSREPIAGAEVAVNVQCLVDESFCINYPAKVYVSDSQGTVRIPKSDVDFPENVTFYFAVRAKGYLAASMIWSKDVSTLFDSATPVELERDTNFSCPGSKDRATVVENDGFLILENDFNGQKYRCSVNVESYICERGLPSILKHWERFDCSVSGESLLEFCLKEPGSKVTLQPLFVESGFAKYCINGEPVFDMDMVSFPKRAWNIYCPLECEII